MPRHRFRSQPALQRSGGRTPPAFVGLLLLAGIAIGGGALLSPLLREFASGSHEFQAGGPVNRPAVVASAEAPRPAEPPAVATQPAIVQAIPEPEASPPPAIKLKARTGPRASRSATPPKYPALKQITSHEDWEHQRLEYQRARDAYDANERIEGARWAQQNRIKVQRYCRAAERRTPAFVEGCMNYVRPMATKRPDNPQEPAGSDQG